MIRTSRRSVLPANSKSVSCQSIFFLSIHLSIKIKVHVYILKCINFYRAMTKIKNKYNNNDNIIIIKSKTNRQKIVQFRKSKMSLKKNLTKKKEMSGKRKKVTRPGWDHREREKLVCPCWWSWTKKFTRLMVIIIMNETK